MLMRYKDIDKMNEKELNKKIEILNFELMKAETMRAKQDPKPGKIKEIRRTIAKIQTKLTELNKKKAETKK
jgi:ribosomal protein L29